LARIVLNTFGSFGDLHPYLALAIELARRGHQPLIATSEVYRTKVEAEGIAFAAVRPDVGELLGQTEFLNQLWDAKHGSKFLLRDYLLPRVEEAFEDLSAACAGANLLVTHAAAYAGPIVAEARKLHWISIALQPAILFSTYDPPVVAPALWARRFYGLGRWVFAAMLKGARYETGRWAKPVFQLREKLGLPHGRNPVIEGQFSPYGTLALFSPHFAQPQPDWPVNTKATGFVSYDKRGEGFGPASDSAELERFLAAGTAPVVFTLGSSAVMAAGRFFEESVQAVTKLGLRAVLLVGKTESLPKVAGESIYVTDYAPYSQLLPRAAATVHQGGIGTTAQALKAGRPMMIVPWAHDQPDNAERCRRLGLSRTVRRDRYRSPIVAGELDRLLRDARYAARAREIGSQLAREDGVKAACDELEANVSCGPAGAR
jgi:UDP:flavonoid glycosyltransferase YjiC (YdhE family)